jgi:heat shock protein HtpX
MHDIIRHNQIRLCIYMLAIMTVFGLLGMLLSSIFHWGLSGTGAFLIVGGLINWVAYFFSDRLIIHASKARQLQREEAAELFSIIDELAVHGEIPAPRLYLLDDTSMNAFTTGRNPEHAAVVVTRGLLEKLTGEEIRGVVAHELAHIRNWDTLLMTAVSVLAGLTRIAPLTGFLVQVAISRQREFLADTSGSVLANNTTGLAASLEKISRDKRPLPRMSNATAHLCFSNPLQEDEFSTHPPIADRIARLDQLRIGA